MIEPEDAVAVDRWTNEGGRLSVNGSMASSSAPDSTAACGFDPTAAGRSCEGASRQRTTSTSQGVSRTTFSAVEPRSARAT